jgi:hypothetical protein
VTDLDPVALAEEMRRAADSILLSKHPRIRVCTGGPLRTLAAVYSDIEAKMACGHINAEHARILLRIRRHTAQTLLLAVKGLDAESVEEVLNAATGAVAATVNRALGWPLL